VKLDVKTSWTPCTTCGFRSEKCQYLSVVTTGSAASGTAQFAMKANGNATSQAQQDIGPYCSHECLRGSLHTNRSTRRQCPNHAAHVRQLIENDQLAPLIMEQLRSTGFVDPGLTSLSQTGRSGVLYRVHVHQTGHVLVAKGYQHCDLKWLQNEAAIYAQLQDLQGRYLPVCCGVVRLHETLDAAGGRNIQHLLLLSWAEEALSGRTIDNQTPRVLEQQVRLQSMLTIGHNHKMQVVHGDTERRNFCSTGPVNDSC
jgi:hypothetical protein